MSEEHRPAFTEADRATFYNTIREHTDQPTAEYLMAHLLPAPPIDLVTKDYLSAELSRFADKINHQHATQRTEDRREYAAQRAEDRKASRNRFFWVMGTGVTLLATILLNLVGIIG